MASDMIRVNTRISRDLNEWLDGYSDRTGMPKSTLIFLALENFRRERDVMNSMTDMRMVVEKLSQLEEVIKRNVQE